MALSLSIGCRDGLANTQGLSEMFNGGTLKILTGFGPGVEYGVTGTELFSSTMGVSSAGTGAILVQCGTNISNTGTAGYFRISHPDDNPSLNASGTAIRMEGTCGITEESCELLFTGLQMTAGAYMSIVGNITIAT